MNFSEPFLRALKCFSPNEVFFFPLVKVTYFLFICFPWNCLSEVPTHLYFVCHRVGETPRPGRQTQRKANTHKPPGSYVASSVQSSVPSDPVCETGSKQDFLWGSGGGGEEKGGLRGRPNVERERLRGRGVAGGWEPGRLFFSALRPQFLGFRSVHGQDMSGSWRTHRPGSLALSSLGLGVISKEQKEKVLSVPSPPGGDLGVRGTRDVWCNVTACLALGSLLPPGRARTGDGYNL